MNFLEGRWLLFIQGRDLFGDSRHVPNSLNGPWQISMQLGKFHCTHGEKSNN